jgi:hypothetical protein
MTRSAAVTSSEGIAYPWKVDNSVTFIPVSLAVLSLGVGEYISRHGFSTAADPRAPSPPV